MSTIYCVYLTCYYGNKLPQFYIGSTSVKNLLSGYKGSVKSKKYANIWKHELANSPHLFRAKMLTRTYSTRELALAAENRLQLKLNVVRSKMYVNMSIACKDGCFGRDVSGVNHPLYGVGHTQSAKAKISANHADFTGNKNGRANIYKFTSPVGEVNLVHGEFKKFCKEKHLPISTMCFILGGREFKTGKCIGWQCTKV